MKVRQVDETEVLVEEGGRQQRVFVAGTASARWVFHEGSVWVIDIAAPPPRSRASGHELVAAPMPATVTRVPVKAGDRVSRGDTVLVLEAMKMELPLRAPRDGTVVSISCAPGDLVQPDVTLVEIE